MAQSPQDFQLNLPSGSKLSLPSGLKLKFLTLGVGTQNYTCTSKGGVLTRTPIGAVSELRDLSGDIATAKTISNQGGLNDNTKSKLNKFPVIGKHLFSGPLGKAVPVFKINNIGTVKVTKAANATSPINPKQNVDWLQLRVTSGDFAKLVFRTSTRGGKPSNNPCKRAGEREQVKYSALYTFWG